MSGLDETESGPNRCVGTADSVISAVNASNNYMLSEVIINCLAYEDDSYTISFGVLSYEDKSGVRDRSTIECAGGLLVLSDSLQEYSVAVDNCYQCQDQMENETCLNNARCAYGCRYCYGESQSECLFCEKAQYNGSCVDHCLPGMTPNPDKGNKCECPDNYGGINCTECILEECPSTYYLNEEECECQVCSARFVFELLDYSATIPEEEIGEPEGEACFENESTHDKKRRKKRNSKKNIRTRTTEHEEEEEEEEEEHLVCLPRCSRRGWRANIETRICYACGIPFCTECDDSRNCLTCRNGSLLTADDECLGFYAEICERAIELEEEVEHERELLAEEKLHLKIVLPIVCTIEIAVFIVLAVFAHFRYPHVGIEKRHRVRNKKTEVGHFERSFRPQATVRFR